MAYEYQVNSFQSGELAPAFQGRSDLEAYKSGLKKLQNMICAIHGGVTRRPGTYLVNEVSASDRYKLIPFKISSTDAFMLVIQNTTMTAYKSDGTKITGGAGTIILTNPPAMTSIDLHSLKHVQVGDIMYLFVKGQRPKKVVWNGNTSTPTLRMTHAATDTDGDAHSRAVIWADELDWSVPGNYPHAVTVYDARMFTGGTPDELNKIYASNTAEGLGAGSPKHTLSLGFTEEGSSNDIVAVTDPGGSDITVQSTAHGLATGEYVKLTGCGGCVEVNSQVYRITATNANNFTLDNTAELTFQVPHAADTGTIYKMVPNILPIDTDALTQTPQAMERLEILWMVGQTYLLLGTTDGLWRGYGPALEDSPSAAGQTLQIKRQSSAGAADTAPAIVSDYVVFVQRGGRHVRQAKYQEVEQQFLAPDLSLQANHLLKAGVTSIAYQELPGNILWCTRNDTGPIALSYSEETGVLGWSQHDFNGVVESIAVLPGAQEDTPWFVVRRMINGSETVHIERMAPFQIDDQTDYHFMDAGVYREGNAGGAVGSVAMAGGSGNIKITMTAHGFSNGENVRMSGFTGVEDMNGIVYTVTNATTNTFELNNTDWMADQSTATGGSVEEVFLTISGLSHLEGETVQIWARGATQADQVVSSGSITLPTPEREVHVGLGITPIAQPIDIPDTDSRIKRIHKLSLRFLDTLGVLIGPAEDDLEFHAVRGDSQQIFDQAPELFTGVEELAFDGDYGYQTDIVISTDQPTPLTILAMIAELEIYE